MLTGWGFPAEAFGSKYSSKIATGKTRRRQAQGGKLFWHSRPGPAAPKASAFPQADLLWALGSVSALHRTAFSADLIAREFPGEGSVGNLVHAARTLGFHIKTITVSAAKLARLPLSVSIAFRGDQSYGQIGPVTVAKKEAATLSKGGPNGAPAHTAEFRLPALP